MPVISRRAARLARPALALLIFLATIWFAWFTRDWLILLLGSILALVQLFGKSHRRR